MNFSGLFKGFFNSEKTGGFILIGCTVISIILANSSVQVPYTQFWESAFMGHSITHWINDGLMTIFFLLIGLELEREIYNGELSDIKNALLPVIAAVGGVVVPATIYLALNYGTTAQPGAGIPMATDIAFAIGILSLLGKRVPVSLKVFLTALAVIDDLLAILVIAIFYSSGISITYLSVALGIWALLLILNRLKIHNLVPYIVGGVFMWYCMLHSGIHATIAGVLLAFAIPFGSGNKQTASYLLQNWLHKPVAFIILPVFALANTAIIFNPGWTEGLFTKEGLGILSGLTIGKPIGILLFSVTAVVTGLCTLPPDLRWKDMFGAALLAGIGFTMSIFITLLAFDDLAQVGIAKTAIIFASLFAAIIGLAWLNFILPKKGD
jgi:NhaA family Na+:H+ antiporter